LSDDFLSRLREDPRPEFEGELREKLRAIDEASPAAVPASRPRRLVPALAGVAAVAALAVALSLEPVRAAAREFLDLFRVQRFAAVRVDPDRLASLQKSGLDLKSLVGGQVDVVVKPVEPVAVTSPEAGAVDAGLREARQPATLPEGFALAGAAVARPGEYRVRLDAEKLRSLAQIAGAGEIEVPDHWTGATIDVAMPPVLVTRYERPGPEGDGRPADAGSYVLLQARSPEIELPEGVDLATLGRLALRVGGLSAEEALSFSQRIDWRSTLLVPVPVSGADYREVEVNGQRGLMVSTQAPPSPSPDGSRRRAGWRSVLMWSEGGNVYALHGPGNGWQLVEMAQTLQ
jgi:hypothetical protein